MKPTDVNDFLGSLNAGVFASQVGRALSDVAAGVVDHGKPGEVTLKFKLKQIGQSHQVAVSHTLDFVQPTKRGKKREDTSLDTPMYVTESGLTLFQNDPTPQMFKPEDAPVKAREV
ncbi:hypothetical protein CXF92_18675 [Pseudomonas sp. Choline-3u-10]|mgnify:FL=1|uniref:Prophage PssSM-02 n=1 Tax=viral metagenome TaxID=1070528 RepID=A0A6M3XA86_9ZZZZ|nr:MULTISPECIES: hypothetical protein [Pseudomonadaceae]MBK3797510.1 hypothetical protein [Stutzerimonas stutzeri]MBK3876349.1 hypothetical protein [Stutzerimonas stutzeri]PKG90938.1 hypothetical protein CXF92_18675 [Pseudomonas sp. Choline-3u-10]|tara:strand:- start:1685 stop:2032 length:348 start_codon:yes stop_codon:yes gene_type:complete